MIRVTGIEPELTCLRVRHSHVLQIQRLENNARLRIVQAILSWFIYLEILQCH